MCTNKHVFEGESNIEIANKIAELNELPKLPPRYSQDMVSIIQK